MFAKILMKNKNSRVAVLTALAVSILISAGCGGRSSEGTYSEPAAEALSSYNGLYETAAEYESSTAEDNDFSISDAETKEASARESGASAGEDADNDTDRKLIKTYYFTAETEDLDAFNEEIEKRTDEFGGYIESSSSSGINYNENGNPDYSSSMNRYASYTIRIPAERADDFADAVEGASNITDRSMTAEDITLHYSDIKSRMEALEAQQDNLMSMMDQAETVDEMIQIENALTEVRSELTEIRSRLRIYDNQVDYSTINLDIREVKKFTVVDPMTDSERMTAGFFQSVQDVTEDIKEGFIWFVINIPHIIVWIIELLIIVLIIRLLAAFLGRVFISKEARAAAKQKRIAKANARKELKKQRLEAAKAQKEADKAE